MDEIKILNTAEEIKAISDPYKYKILSCFEHFGEPATVKQVADRLGEVPAKVYYHVKKMEKLGIVKLVYTKDINGIVAKYYEPAAKEFNVPRDGENSFLSKHNFSQTEKVLSNMYEISFNEAIKTVKDKHDKNVTDESIIGISLSNIYLTKEEAKEFKDYIYDFINKHDENNDDKKGEYQFFVSFIKK